MPMSDMFIKRLGESKGFKYHRSGRASVDMSQYARVKPEMLLEYINRDREDVNSSRNLLRELSRERKSVKDGAQEDNDHKSDSLEVT